jgi:nondiscriminating glutamyl-tRNA synthetase
MPAEGLPESTPVTPGEEQPAARFGAGDVGRILRERGWLGAAEEQTPAECRAWQERAALLLGPQAENREELEALLQLVFHYDVGEILASAGSHAVLARAGARQVIRELGREVLGGPEIDSARLKDIVNEVIERTGCRGRELFHPLRLALTGRPGDGGLDRVVLLLDAAARLPFAVPVKSTRARMMEFCTRLD